MMMMITGLFVGIVLVIGILLGAAVGIIAMIIYHALQAKAFMPIPLELRLDIVITSGIMRYQANMQDLLDELRIDHLKPGDE